MFFSYETEINKVEDYHRSKFGFMNRTSFCKLSDNIFTLVPPDTMHDLSEGVLPTIIATIMKSFKVKRIEINGRINEHHWVNGPVFIENSLEPKGKAIQVRSKVKLMVGFNEYLNIFYYEKKKKLEFFIRIVELYPTWLESGSEIFKWYEAMRTVISVSMSSNPPIDKLDRIMAEYMEVRTYSYVL